MKSILMKSSRISKRIIGIAGAFGSGKTTAANYFFIDGGESSAHYHRRLSAWNGIWFFLHEKVAPQNIKNRGNEPGQRTGAWFGWGGLC